MAIDDGDILACADRLMRRHGARAWLHASVRAGEHLVARDIAGHGIWLRILRRIEELEQSIPSGSVP
jgi:hypothetical protein